MKKMFSKLRAKGAESKLDMTKYDKPLNTDEGDWPYPYVDLNGKTINGPNEEFQEFDSPRQHNYKIIFVEEKKSEPVKNFFNCCYKTAGLFGIGVSVISMLLLASLAMHAYKDDSIKHLSE